ncbi:chlorophyll synthase ChlG [Magnetospirillum fulvum]|uniref:Chlorophyll synthase n=1 Tax=Magnetospirillum fulvum TaxID=1082 RepID=A0A1H6HEZ0_MAGFU|nr:chlorophyll synthase ChlG [Magnetospirillum fulvum]SEH34341.1 chlorophyll synthase [Magnetospirillum fulvum]
MDLVKARAIIAPSVELLKPITWFPPMWAFACGVVSSGQSVIDHFGFVVAGVALAGPLVCGTSQAVNDWFDRHVDAINEPNRPIPSGRLPGQTGLYIAIGWTALSAWVAFYLGAVVFVAALLGLALAWAYSAPPWRLKENGWHGNLACAACYEGLPWITGAAVMTGGLPDWKVFALAALYSAGAHGIMTLNDFKSVEGDRQMGVNSLPVLLGPEKAGVLACKVMAIPQAVVILLLLLWGHTTGAAIVTLLLAIQGVLMVKLLKRPAELAPWYNATGITLYVLGMMVSAVALNAGVTQ